MGLLRHRPEPDKIETLDDLLPTIELFHHVISAGAYEEAFEIYQGLAAPLYYQLGAYDTRIALSQAFFPDGADKPPRLETHLDQAWLLNGLAISYNRIGQSRKCVRLLEQARAIRVKERFALKPALVVSLVNLADNQILLGELETAKSSARQAADIAREIKDEEGKALGHRLLGLIFTYMGRYSQADKEFETAFRMFARQNMENAQCVVSSSCAFRSIVMSEPSSAFEALKKALQFWELDAEHDAPVERDLVRILWLSGAAKRGTGNVAAAEADLNEALSRCRRIRLIEFEAEILLEMAKLHWAKAQGKNAKLIEQAQSLTREALDIADRCEYRLKQADIQNFLAQMALAEDDKATAKKHAETAAERAYCDGPPHCYKKALDQANDLLAQLQ